MPSVITELFDLSKSRTAEAGSFCVGQIVRITEDGKALVDYPGNPIGPLVARSVLSASPKPASDQKEAVPVMLVFENGDPLLPIIVGILHDTLFPPSSKDELTVSTKRPHDIILDGEKLIFDAKKEIVLRCGKGSITLTKDGTIVLKGAQLLSRASGANKIKGSTISIN